MPNFTRTRINGQQVAVLESEGFAAIEVHPRIIVTGTREDRNGILHHTTDRSYVVVRADEREEIVAEFRTQRDAKAYAVEAWEIDREG